MNKFSDLMIEPYKKVFVGDKIKVANVLDKEITLVDFRIVDSKHPKEPGDKCIHLQIEFKEEKRVMFSISKYLIDIAKRVDKEKLPLTTTIIKQENGSFIFT